jgi:excisionase family DNA binding protein
MHQQSKQSTAKVGPKTHTDPPKYASSPPAAYPLAVVCRDFGICRATVYNLIRRGILKGVKVGNKRVFPASEIAKLLSGESEP